MTSKERVLNREYMKGLHDATALQSEAANMTGTQLNAELFRVPAFNAAKVRKNMLERPVNFICKTSAGRLVKLLQPYDSTIYPDEPENLPAQWGFVWSHNPKHALPFISLATSPYNTGDCCTFDGATYRSTHDTNTWSPKDYPAYWEMCKE